MLQTSNGEQSNFMEIVILALVPALVLVLTIASWGLEHWAIGPYWLSAGLAVVATLFGGFRRFVGGFKDIINRQITVDVFVAIALIASLVTGQFRSAAVIVFIMAVAGALESYTLDKTRGSIRNLLDLTPKMASVRQDKDEVMIPVSEVQKGDIVVVRPGERIPVDGVVVAGISSVNQAPVTGESIPVEKTIGDEVYSGTLNEVGYLDIRTTNTGEDATLAKIVHLVEVAQGTKAPIQAIADRFTVWFLPLVLVVAVIGYWLSGDVKVAVSILLVACPCAFAIATPTAVTAGISNMARRAILIKGGVFLELAGKMDTLLMDKTGTFTLGKPKVVDVEAFNGGQMDDVVRLAAIGEKYSNHPLARAVMAYAQERSIDVPDPEEFKEEIGKGILATWGDKKLLIGKYEFLLESNISLTEHSRQRIQNQTAQGRTTILINYDGITVGLIAIADEIRPETAQAISLFRKMGVNKVIMLTGDNERVAQAVAREIGVDDVIANLLPEQKQEYVKRLQEEGHIVGMVGDGINDAPALALADIGIAMGAGGTHIAIETADVTLMNDNLHQIAIFIWMSKKVLRRIKLNMFFSIVYNAIGLLLGMLGMLTPILAVSLQEAGCVTVVFSSVLLLWAKPGVLLSTTQE